MNRFSIFHAQAESRKVCHKLRSAPNSRECGTPEQPSPRTARLQDYSAQAGGGIPLRCHWLARDCQRNFGACRYGNEGLKRNKCASVCAQGIVTGALIGAKWFYLQHNTAFPALARWMHIDGVVSLSSSSHRRKAVLQILNEVSTPSSGGRRI
jgi:hypothetical protein